ELAWAATHAQQRRVVSVPAYPFARDRHWIEPAAAAAPAAPAQAFNLLQPYAAAATTLITTTSADLESAPVALSLAGVAPMDQQTQLLNALRELFAESSGEDLSQVAPDTSFLELGFD